MKFIGTVAAGLLIGVTALATADVAPVGALFLTGNVGGRYYF